MSATCLVASQSVGRSISSIFGKFFFMQSWKPFVRSRPLIDAERALEREHLARAADGLARRPGRRSRPCRRCRRGRSPRLAAVRPDVDRDDRHALLLGVVERRDDRVAVVRDHDQRLRAGRDQVLDVGDLLARVHVRVGRRQERDPEGLGFRLEPLLHHDLEVRAQERHREPHREAGARLSRCRSDRGSAGRGASGREGHRAGDERAECAEDRRPPARCDCVCPLLAPHSSLLSLCVATRESRCDTRAAATCGKDGQH